MVAVGDAENDHAFLQLCHASAAVANALDTVKQRVDLVTERDHGAGVCQLIDMMVEDDLADLESRLLRHDIPIAHDSDGRDVLLRTSGNNVLIVGKSGSGKSTLTTALVERLRERDFQFCIIDPEGDYQNLAGSISFGNADHPPDVEELTRYLETTDQNAVANMIGVRLVDRPAEFAKLLSALQHLRSQYGRPHWIVVDEAHHVLPAAWEPSEVTLPLAIDGMAYITMEPNLVHVAVLKTVNTLLAVGDDAAAAVEEFCRCVGAKAPDIAARSEEGKVLLWDRRSAPQFVDPISSQTERRRHIRK